MSMTGIMRIDRNNFYAVKFQNYTRTNIVLDDSRVERISVIVFENNDFVVGDSIYLPRVFGREVGRAADPCKLQGFAV